jgi:hypothetical protein
MPTQKSQGDIHSDPPQIRRQPIPPRQPPRNGQRQRPPPARGSSSRRRGRAKRGCMPCGVNCRQRRRRPRVRLKGPGGWCSRASSTPLARFFPPRAGLCWGTRTRTRRPSARPCWILTPPTLRAKETATPFTPPAQSMMLRMPGAHVMPACSCAS